MIKIFEGAGIFYVLVIVLFFLFAPRDVQYGSSAVASNPTIMGVDVDLKIDSMRQTVDDLKEIYRQNTIQLESIINNLKKSTKRIAKRHGKIENTISIDTVTEFNASSTHGYFTVGGGGNIIQMDKQIPTSDTDSVEFFKEKKDLKENPLKK